MCLAQFNGEPRWLRPVERQPRKLSFEEKSVNWASFREYLLKRHSKGHVKNVMNYCLKYGNCLLTEDFSLLSGVSVEKRRNILTALSNLSKFLGKHEVFKWLMKDYGLKWQTTKAEDLLISRMTKVKDNGEVLQWIHEIKGNFPGLETFLEFVLVSGLRFSEAINSYDLIIDLAKENRLNEYYIEDREVLEHFRFKKLFLRNTKKVFVSFVPRELIKRIGERERITSCQIRNRLKRNNYGMRFPEVRQYFATYMTKHLTQPEIDFLQGRVSTNVFMRNYFNPALITDLKERVFKGIADLKVLA